jgi:hypothetical protein
LSSPSPPLTAHQERTPATRIETAKV